MSHALDKKNTDKVSCVCETNISINIYIYMYMCHGMPGKFAKMCVFHQKKPQDSMG